MNVSLIYFIVLRALHILGGAGWLGGAVVHTFFIAPSVKDSAPEGNKFMQQLMGRHRFPLFMNLASLITVLSGALLYWRDLGGFNLTWVQTGPGLGFTIGSVVGILVYLFGLFVIKPRAEQSGSLGAAIAAAGGPPTGEQVAELERLDGELASFGRIDFTLLMISMLAMATARFWLF
jgi:uncharacterized membrane protein